MNKWEKQGRPEPDPDLSDKRGGMSDKTLGIMLATIMGLIITCLILGGLL